MESLERPPLRTFTLFHNLPSELRLKIWRFTFIPNGFRHDMLWDTRWNRLRARSKPPVALFVNHESHAEALRYYPKIDVTRSAHKVWFSPEIDTLFIPFSAFPSASHHSYLGKRNAILFARSRYVLIWRDDLKRWETMMAKVLEDAQGPVPIGKAGGAKNEWLSPFERVEILTFHLGKKESDADCKLFLEEVRLWYGELRKYHPWRHIQVPRLLVVQGRDGKIRATLAGRGAASVG